MRRFVVGLLSLAVAGVTGLLLATSEFSLYNVVEWFGASFENVKVGTKLAAGTGVTTVDGVRSGTWAIPSGAGDSQIIEENGVRYLNVYSPMLTSSGPWLSTTTAAFAGGGDAYRIDCTTKFPITDSLPTLPSGVKSAMALSNRDGGLSFYGYGANGWTRLFDSELEVSTAVYYDQRAEFRRINGVLYVTYSIKNGSEYVELKDPDGNILLPAADQGSVRMLEFRGISNVKSITGSKLKSSVTAVDVAPEGYPMTLLDWFSVLMAGVDVGTILKDDTGVIGDSGQWEYPYTGFTAEVAEDDGERYLCVEQGSSGITGPKFTAKRASADDRSEIEFSMRFSRSSSVLENSLDDSTKAAMSMADADGETFFYGFAKGGWQKLVAVGVEAKYSVWYDLMATFENEDDVLYVSYYAKTYFGYVQFVNEKGVGRFVTAGSGKSPVQYTEVLGDTDVRFMTGTDMTFDPTISFYWIGGVLGDWANGANWSHSSGGPAANDYPKAGDSAIVESKATIEIHGADANVSNLVVSAPLTLTTDDRNLSAVVWGGTYGSGKIILAGASLRAGAAKEMSFGCNLEIAEGTENRIVNYNDGDSAYQLKFTGYLTGKGTVTFTEGRSTNGVDVASGGGVRLLGDTSDFAGTARFVYTNKHAKVAFESEASSDNRESYWSLFEEGTVPSAGTGTSDTGLPQFPFKESGRTYRFGAIAGTIPAFKTAEAANLVTNIVLEVGATGAKSSLGGDWMNADSGRTIRWIASAGSQFEYDVRNTTLIEIVGGGSFKLMSADAIALRITFADLGGFLQFADGVDPSATIRGSAAPIGVDDEGRNGVWSTALDSSNLGGLVKRGTGTLRLKQIPRYSGATRVEEGELIIPWGTALGQLEIAEGARVIIDLAGIGSSDRLVFAVGSSMDGIKGRFDFINKPDGYVLPDPLWTDGGGVIYSTDTHVFTWTGAADNGGLWSTPGNWSVNGVPATKTPGDYDVVKVPVLKSQQRVVVDIAANVWSIQCEVGVRPFKFVSPAVTNTNYAVDDTSVLTTGSGELPGMSGVGGFKTSSSIVFDIAADETNRFFGPMSAQSMVKRSDGVAIIAGENTFNAISLEGGLLKLGNQLDVEDIRMDCDASDERSFTYSGDTVKTWRSQVGDLYFTYSSGEQAAVTTNFFGGKASVFLRPNNEVAYSRYCIVTNGTDVSYTRSVFVLYHAVAVEDNAYLYAGVTSTAKDRLRIWGSGDMHCWYNPNVGSAAGVFTGLDYGSKVIADGSDYLTSWFGMNLGSQLDYLGGTGSNELGVRAAIAEVVGYSRDLTHAERLAIQRSLMTKWGLSVGDCEVLPRCAAMTMYEGAVLDLGGFAQTVASFTGAGVVSNGVLATENGVVTEDGGALTIPAVNGTTYHLMKRQAKLVLTGGKDMAVTVVVPDGCTSGSVYFEGFVDWKVTDPGITIDGPKSGWYDINNTGGGSCIIIR